jgi:oligoribonuclease NrnB/cAMP/cGMP phosphodiesterase (DHH superfamily)
MIVSLTHEHDLDGLGSQAIIRRYFNLSSENRNNEITYYFADYTNFVEKINTILSTEPFPSQLIISDIGFNESFKDIFSVFKDAEKRGCKICWFDHHLVEETIKEELKTLIHLYINDTKKCAAEIVKEYYMKNDPIASKIAEFARDTDFETNKYNLASELQSIISYNRGDRNDQNKLEIVRLLSQGDFHNPWFMEQLKSLKKWFEDESTFSLNHAMVFPVEFFGEIVISWAKIGGGRIARILKPEYSDAKAFIGIDTRNYDIIIHSKFINCREFAREFEGGGHKPRAGFKYPHIFEKPNVLTQSFIEDIKKKIVKFRV